MSVVCISGGFDFLHKGHVSLINHASTYGNVVVILNSDDWLMRKKGYVVMPWDDRAYILMSLKHVHSVVPVDDSDGSVVEALRRIKPDYFANGGDRVPHNTPEMKECIDLGIKPLWGIGGGKVASSQELVREAKVDPVAEAGIYV